METLFALLPFTLIFIYADTPKEIIMAIAVILGSWFISYKIKG